MQHPDSNGFVSGKEALRCWWKDAFERLPSLNYKVKSVTANGDRVFMEYIRTVCGEADLQVAEVLDFKENKTIASRVYHG
jgi:predicted SnoaL-like aldol condensation-catalyzing enzyme